METAEIIRLLKQKDETALSYLYDHYSGALNSIILRILRSEKLAEDVLQETFFKIWDKIELYDESKSRLFTWMSRIARNTAIDTQRLKSHKNSRETKSLDINVHNQQSIQMNLASLDVQTLISQLDEKHRTILNHTYLNGYTQSETAEILQIPLGTVKTRVRRAILELRSILKKEKVLFGGTSTIVIILIAFLCL